MIKKLYPQQPPETIILLNPKPEVLISNEEKGIIPDEHLLRVLR
jgi:hypothetical protein